MELFSEIHNCYYQVLKQILSGTDGMTEQELTEKTALLGYEESMFHMIPKLISGDWHLLRKEGKLYFSSLSEQFSIPLSNLQRSYIKTILTDERIQLFFTLSEIKYLNELLKEEPLLWQNNFIHYVDQFSDQDDYSDEEYQRRFHILLDALQKKAFVRIPYTGKGGRTIIHHCVPARLEYSIKNNKFRLLCLSFRKSGTPRLNTFNLNRIQDVELTKETISDMPDINTIIKNSYYKEPVHLRIHTDRNTLERTMLQFANYEKNTIKIDDHTYECMIYYNQNMETELLIEVLSFGPMVEVLGNKNFKKLFLERLQKQKSIMH